METIRPSAMGAFSTVAYCAVAVTTFSNTAFSQEQSAKQPQSQIVDETFWNNVPAHLTTQSEEEEIARMERCLKKLPRSEARLLRNYYLAAADNPMQVRKGLAESLGISANTLRQRVFLARQSLRICMTAVERKRRK